MGETQIEYTVQYRPNKIEIVLQMKRCVNVRHEIEKLKTDDENS